MKRNVGNPGSQSTAILSTLVGVARCHNKAYCWVSQKHLLELMAKYHSWNISRRTLNRRLRELEKEGYFVRIRRHQRGPDNKLILRSTLYKFCGKLFNWLYGVKRWVEGIFRVFAVPKWAQYYFPRERRVYHKLSPYPEIMVLRNKDGSLCHYNARDGTLCPVAK